MTTAVVPSVNVKFDDPQNLISPHEELLMTRCIEAAIKLDTAALQVHAGATINLMVHADPSIAEVASSPSSWVATATPGVVQSAAESVINTGHQPTSPHPWQDGDIYVNPTFVATQLSYNSHLTPNSVVPADKVDAVSLFAHEGLHVMGMEGFLNQQSIAPPDVALTEKSNFDALVKYTGSGPQFDGASAEAQNGGNPVELTAGDLYHFGDANTLAYDLMNGDHIYTGYQYQPSALDDGMLVDLGYHLNPSDHLLAGFYV